MNFLLIPFHAQNYTRELSNLSNVPEAVTMHYRGQDPEAPLLVISGAKQKTASGPTIARLRRSFVLHRQHKLGWTWRRLPLLSSHAGYWKYDKSEILQLKFEFCSAQISGKTWKPWKLRNLFSTSWTSCETRNLTAKHFILNDELGGDGGGGGGGGGVGLSGKIPHAIHWFEKSTTEPSCCFSSNNSTCYNSI